MEVNARIAEIIEPTVEAMGFELVRVLVSGQQRVKLQVMAERADGTGMTVEDCADLSRAISALLDVDDPIDTAYTLEVSSPGIDRPLTREKDFVRFAGFEARVESSRPIDGRRRFTGRLLGIEDGVVRVETQEGEAEIPFGDVSKAKLLMTDELMAAAAKEQERA